MSKRRKLLISIDGLSKQGFSVLCGRLKSSRQFLNPDRALTLNSIPLTSAHGIWAAILTRSDWHKNGCVDYAYPSDSLSTLKVCTENDLKSAIQFGMDNETSLFVNVPIVSAGKAKRIWLADGSSPTFRRISPESLEKNESLAKYQPRPYAGLVLALRNPTQAVTECLKVEARRIENARQLLKDTDWQCGIIRLSAFDQLGHLFGPNFLLEAGLKAENDINTFIAQFDDFLHDVFTLPSCAVSILSGFSLTECLAQINLNQLLKAGGFIDTRRAAGSSISQTRANLRASATRAISAAAVGVAIDENNVVPTISDLKSQWVSAASPVSGCIYINDQTRFVDGTVPPEALLDFRSQLEHFVQRRIESKFGSAATMFTPPAASAENIPDIVVHAEGIEFYSAEAPPVLSFGLPKAVHKAEGFLLAFGNPSHSSAHVSPGSVLSFLE